MAFIGNTNTTQGFIPAVDFFSGNGSTVAFTLSRPVASVAQVEVYVSNVPQTPNTAFSVSGNTITFTSAPLTGTNNIYVYYTSPITQVIAPSQGTVTSSSFGVITDFTTTGNTILGDASTDTLNVGNGGLVKDASGNVGIGTTSPNASYKMSITGNSASIYSGILFTDTNAGGGVFSIYGESAALKFRDSSAGATRMTIDSSGNLLVGGTSLNESFSGIPTVQGSTNCIFTNKRSTTSSASQFRFYNPNGQVGDISTSGSATTYGTSSDYRLKENVAPMTGALSTVAQLKPCTYTWKIDGSSGQGFIAHELQAVVPDCVTGEKDAVNEDGSIKPQGIDTSFLVATLTAAIQEQQALITTLTDRITALENK